MQLQSRTAAPSAKPKARSDEAAHKVEEVYNRALERHVEGSGTLRFASDIRLAEAVQESSRSNRHLECRRSKHNARAGELKTGTGPQRQ